VSWFGHMMNRVAGGLWLIKTPGKEQQVTKAQA
jgi:hypothetical protein